MTGSPAPPVDVYTLAMDLSARGWTCSSFHVITRTGRPMWAVEGEREGHVLLCGFFHATVGGGRWSLSHCHLGRCLTDEELDRPLDPAMVHVLVTRSQSSRRCPARGSITGWPSASSVKETSPDPGQPVSYVPPKTDLAGPTRHVGPGRPVLEPAGPELVDGPDLTQGWAALDPRRPGDYGAGAIDEVNEAAPVYSSSWGDLCQLAIATPETSLTITDDEIAARCGVWAAS